MMCSHAPQLLSCQIPLFSRDLVLRAQDHVDQGRCRADGEAERARIVPLVGPEVDVEDVGRGFPTRPDVSGSPFCAGS